MESLQRPDTGSPSVDVAAAFAERNVVMTETEWRLRLELAACYRIFDFLGWSEAIFNHITVRVPGPEGHYLINPFGLTYDEVTASNLLKVDLGGQVQNPGPYPGNRAGFIIHGAIHAARDDVHCVMHTHTTAGMTVACKRGGLTHDNFYGAQLVGRVGYHDFEGIAIRTDEQPRIAAALGDRDILVLQNHGLLVAQADIPTALLVMWTLERACQVQCNTDAAAGEGIVLSEEVRRTAASDVREFDRGGFARLGRTFFDALRRQMERARSAEPHYIDYRT